MSEAIRASRARLAGLTARHGAEDPATIEAKRNHRLLSVEECIEKNLRDCPSSRRRTALEAHGHLFHRSEPHQWRWVMTSAVIYRNHRCTRTHRTFNAWAKCTWLKRHGWVLGEGEYASISYCGIGAGAPYGITVELHETLAEALAAKNLIDNTKCGGRCRGAHRVARIDMKDGQS